MDFWYNFAKGILRAYRLFLFAGFNVQGRENIQPGPKIVVANHANATDAFFLPFIFPEKLHVFAMESLFRVTFFGSLLRLADQIPVIPGRGQELLSEACDRLSRGQTVVIFPEGHLTHGKDLGRARSGAAVLALESGAPLIPVGFFVPDEFRRKIQQKKENKVREGYWQMGGCCYIQIGEPWKLDLSDYQDWDSRTLEEISEGILERVQKLVRMAENNSK
jgi:1-acyl-sn-glycerol-3-phosphate acyltransferase